MNQNLPMQKLLIASLYQNASCVALPGSRAAQVYPDLIIFVSSQILSPILDIHLLIILLISSFRNIFPSSPQYSTSCPSDPLCHHPLHLFYSLTVSLSNLTCFLICSCCNITDLSLQHPFLHYTVVIVVLYNLGPLSFRDVSRVAL